MKKGIYLGFGFALLISGCSIAPGIYMDRVDVPEQEKEPASVLGDQSPVIPITPELAAQSRIEYAMQRKQRRIEADQRFLQEQNYSNEFTYKVGLYDVLNITVWGHPEFNISATSSFPGLAPQPITFSGGNDEQARRAATATGHLVDSEGNIFFPQIGVIQVAGLSSSEIRELLTQKLRAIIPDPQLDIGVVRYRSQKVYVFGKVENPKVIPVTDVPLTILEALSHVGKYKDGSEIFEVNLVRNEKSYLIDVEAIYNDGDLSQNYILKDGDVLHFPDHTIDQVYAVGEFQNNVSVPLPGHFFSAADLIQNEKVGGLNLDSVDAGQIFIFRYREVPPDEYHENTRIVPQVFQLDISSAESMLLAANFPLQSNDVLFAAPTSLTRWNRVVLQILPTLRMIWYPLRIARDYEIAFGD
jgi:polysaccharide export outer membrane protein